MHHIGALLLLLIGMQVSWGSDSFSYSGRLVNADGSPVTGSVDLTADLAYSNATTVILCSQNHTGVALSNGVFHLKLDLDCTPKTITQILAATPATHSVAIRITDVTHGKIYSFQALHSMPYANVSKQLVQMGATDGQLLTWDNGEWKPLAPAAVESGSIGTAELADGSVTDSKVASGISRSKLASGAGGYVLVNDGSSGLITETQYLSVAQGGTGATTVPGIFANLGLGAAATADLGLTTGNALAFDDLKFCLPTEKLLLTAAPTVQWICGPENTPEDSTKLPLAGGTMSGAIDMNTNRITGLGAPIDPDEAVNKAYADTLSESNWKSSGTHAYYNNTGNVGVGVSTPTEKLDIAGNVALSGGLRLRSGTNYVEIKAPTLAGSILFVLPATDGGPGQVLKTDGSGNLGWIDSTAGSITSVTASLPLSATTTSGATALSLNYDGSTIGMNGSNQLSIPNGGITDTQINASAAIAWSKINKTGSAAADIGAASELVSIVAGTGLSGGGSLVADRTLNVNVGTGANQIVQMDATAKLPAIDGSQLINLPIKWVDATGGINYPSGNVGIGTTTPSFKLDVSGKSRTSATIAGAPGSLTFENIHTFETDSSNALTAYGIRFSNTTTANNANIGLTVSNASSYGELNNSLYFDSPADFIFRSNSSNNVVIKSSGNVGIGTTTPTEALTVAGTIQSTAGGVKFPDGSVQTTAAAGGVPTGAVFHFIMQTCPAGYIAANGAAISRTTYSALYAAVGVTFGAGDGTSTFNLPDLRGEFVRGWDNGRGVDSGRAFGSAQSHMARVPDGTMIRVGAFGNGDGTHDANGVSNVAQSNDMSPAPWGNSNTRFPETRPRNIALLACIKI